MTKITLKVYARPPKTAQHKLALETQKLCHKSYAEDRAKLQRKNRGR